MWSFIIQGIINHYKISFQPWAETKKFMKMENFRNLGKKLKKVVGIGALAGASMLSPKDAQASLHEIAKANTAVEVANFKVEKAKTPEEKLKAEKELVLVKARLEEVKAKDLDEREAREEKKLSGDPDTGFGRPYVKEKDLAVSSEVEIDIFDKDGKKIGTKTVKKDSKQAREHKKKMEEERTKQERARSFHLYDDDVGGHYNRGISGGHEGVNVGREGYVEPYQPPRGGRRSGYRR